MSEPTGFFTQSNDDRIRSRLKDIVVETQAETNKLITQKYNTLSSLKYEMTQMKRDFNRNVLSMQNDKHEKCRLLTMKIETFRRNYDTLHPNGQLNRKMDIDVHADTILTFDGTSFQVNQIDSNIYHRLL